MLLRPNQRIRAVFYALSAIALVVFVLYDARQHFDAELVELKKQHYSGQRNWSLFFGQSNVYHGAGLLHADDFERLRPMLKADSAFLTDLATSYYMLSSLPLYAKNVHIHHGRYKSPEWNSFINAKVACYIDVPEYLQKFKNLMAKEPRLAKRRGLPPVRYMVINTMHDNINLRRDCLSQRRGPILATIPEVGRLVFQGETLTVYEISGHSVEE